MLLQQTLLLKRHEGHCFNDAKTEQALHKYRCLETFKWHIHYGLIVTTDSLIQPCLRHTDSATCPFRSSWTSIFNMEVRWRHTNYFQFSSSPNQRSKGCQSTLSLSSQACPELYTEPSLLGSQVTSYVQDRAGVGTLCPPCKAPRRLCIVSVSNKPSFP